MCDGECGEECDGECGEECDGEFGEECGIEHVRGLVGYTTKSATGNAVGSVAGVGL